jgi:uncharacterized protein (TIGR02271 family)
MRSVIALYEDRKVCRSALDELVEHGFEKERISVVSNGHDTTGRTEKELMRDLDARNVPRDDAERYIESVRRGRALVLVDTNDERASEASSILDRHTPVDFEPETGRASMGESSQRMDVVEEEVKIGKRPVQRGGVRIHTHVTERPVEENIELREEHAHVERRRADETLSPAEAERAFKEETIEVTTHGEEPMVTKEAHVVERVDVGKEVETRTARVRETERRQDVEVERLGTDDDEARRDWEANYKSKGMDYETYRHAYGVGHRAGGDERHRKSDYRTAEPGLRREWEKQHHQHGPWDKFRAAVQRGWDRARGK